MFYNIFKFYEFLEFLINNSFFNKVNKKNFVLFVRHSITVAAKH